VEQMAGRLFPQPGDARVGRHSSIFQLLKSGNS
jgi:hypothetical protein